jgi:hypothetical protein
VGVADDREAPLVVDPVDGLAEAQVPLDEFIYVEGADVNPLGLDLDPGENDEPGIVKRRLGDPREHVVVCRCEPVEAKPPASLDGLIQGDGAVLAQCGVKVEVDPELHPGSLLSPTPLRSSWRPSR